MSEYRWRAAFYIRYVLYVTLGLLTTLLALMWMADNFQADAWVRYVVAGLIGAVAATATKRAIRRRIND